jgi:hypothetical protein
MNINSDAGRINFIRIEPAESTKAIQKQLPGRKPGRRTERQRGGTVTPNQLKAIYGMARRQQIDPQKLAYERFDRYVPEDLTEASRLIDELNLPSRRPPSRVARFEAFFRY